jgi:hypothetical protein
MLAANEEANMTVLDTLNFVALKPLANNNPTAVCRRKLIAKWSCSKMSLEIQLPLSP